MSQVILVDFDGTCVEHAFPAVGADIGAQRVLKKLVANGHRLILYTMRYGDNLKEAQRWFSKNNIPLYASQWHPTQKSWTSSNKAHGDLCIDDRNLGTPLREDSRGKPCVDWDGVESLLIAAGLIR